MLTTSYACELARRAQPRSEATEADSLDYGSSDGRRVAAAASASADQT